MFYFKAVFPKEATGISSDAPLSINEMSVTINTRPAQSVTAQADYENYRFIGWYKDKACTIPVTNTETTDIVTSDPSDSNNNNKLLPLASNVDVTYYAKYDYKRGDLTITNTFAEGETPDNTQGFEYIIQGADEGYNSWVNLKVCIVGAGSQTIKDLPIGSYTVTQTGWSWRYDKDTKITKTVNVVSTPTKEVTFTQTMSNTKWLDGNGYLDNNFTTVTTTTTEESN
jgi:uncharacterized repeat protein (TIGR02543 family)